MSTMEPQQLSDAGVLSAAESSASNPPCPSCAALPKVELRYNFSHKVKVRKARAGDKPPNVFSLAGEVLYGIGTGLYRKFRKTMIGGSEAGAGERGESSKFFQLRILDGVRGVLRPGRPTALLAAPGAGSSTFLRLIASREGLQADDLLTFNGSSRHEVETAGVNPKRFSSFCASFEAHEPLLTVKETFDFAHRCLHARSAKSAKSAKEGQPPSAPEQTASVPTVTEHCEWCQPKTPDEMIRILDLDEARDTYVGSGMIRGVSGGQKRRVTVGESLLMHSRVLALDNATSGLDASTAYKVCKWICKFTRETGAVTVMSLQQPTLETFALFSDVILLSEGREIYHGPVDQLERYLDSLGFVRPRFLDIADYASEVVADPVRAAELSINDRLDKALTPQEAQDGEQQTIVSGIHAQGAGGTEKEGVFGERASSASAGVGMTGSSTVPPSRKHLTGDDLKRTDGFPLPQLLTIEALCEHWRTSPSGLSLMQGRADKVKPAAGATTASIVPVAGAGAGSASNLAPSPLHRAEQPGYNERDVNDFVYSSDYAASTKQQPEKGVPLVREEDRFRYGFENSPTPLQQARLTIGRQLTLNTRNRSYMIARWANALLMGLILGTVALNPPLSNFPLRVGLSLYSVIFVSFANSAEMPIVLNGRSVAYKHTAMGFYSPLSFIAGSIVGTLPIALVADLIFSNLVYWMTGFAPEFDQYLFFLLVLFSMDLLVAAIFRTMMLSGRQQDASQAVGMAVISIFMLSSGFFIIRSQLPSWLQWLPWLSFFWYAISSLANNEAHASRWQRSSPQDPSKTVGQVFLSLYDIPYSRTLQWMAVVYILSLWLLVGWVLSPLALDRFRFDTFPGTVRRTVVAQPDPESVLVTTGIVALPPDGAAMSAPPSPPPPPPSAPGPPPPPAPPTAEPISATETTPAWQSSSEQECCGIASTHSGSRRFEGVEAISGSAALPVAGSSGPPPTAGDISGAFGSCALPTVVGTGSGASLPGATELVAAGAVTQTQVVGGSGEVTEEELSRSELHSAAQRPTFASEDATVAALDPAAQPAVPTDPASIPASAPAAPASAPAAPASAPAPPATVDFPKACLAWKNVSYWVKTPGGEKQLLHEVSGFALPYTTTALMGASGAGKSTLLDCILGRKTTGRMQGSVTINGVPATKALLQSLTAFAEQEDVHLPTLSVEESLLFSANLRMPHGVSGKQRDAALTRISKVLELDTISKRLVGTLSKNELKRLTIGTELAKLPSIVACDEPTSFLSANNAAVVIRALRRVAKTGRCVIATIHQPSADVFINGFDNLILLAPSGRLAYFGPVGHNAMKMVSYFHGLHPLFRLPPATNPASWMIAVVDGDTSVFGQQPATQDHDANSDGAGAATGEGKREMTAPDESESKTGPAPSITNKPSPTPSATAVDMGTGATSGGLAGAAMAAGGSGIEALLPVPGGGGEAQKTEDGQEAHWHCASDFTPIWFEQRYRESTLWKEQSTKLDGLCSLASRQEEKTILYDGVPLARLDPTRKPPSHRAHFWTEYLFVQSRANTDWWRSAEFQLTRLTVILFLSLLLGILFMDVSFAGFQGTQSAIGFFLTGVTYPSILFFTAAITARFERREVFYRERAAGFYSPETFTLSSLFADIPYVAVMILVSVSITYWMIGLKPDAGSFFFFYLAALILAFFFLAIGLAYTALFPVLPIAQLVGGLTISLSFLFSGLFIPFSVIPGFWKGLYYAVPPSHILRAIATDQFYCEGGTAAGCPSIEVVSGPGGETKTIGRYEYVSSFLGSTYQKRWGELGWAALAGLVVTVIALLAYRFVNWQKK